MLPTAPHGVYPWLKERTLDQLVGIEDFSLNLSTKLKGRLRSSPEDFIVSEVLRNGSLATTVTQGGHGHGDVPVYVLSKVGLDTPTAVREFSSTLGLKPWDVKYLGLKDKRAMTLQFVSLALHHGTPPAMLRGEGWEARVHTFTDRPLRSLDLCGNMFWVFIRLRDPIQTQQVQEVLAEFDHKLSKTGMLNFFGYQRFGGRKPINHVAGYLVAKREYSAATRLILGTPCRGEERSLKEARTDFLDGKEGESLSRLVRSPFPVERSLARNLVRYEGDSRKSILRLPSNLLRFLLEAFSSFLFNVTVSQVGDRLKSWEAQRDLLYVSLDTRGSPFAACARVTPSSIRAIEEDVRRKKAVPAIACPGFQVEEALTRESKQVMSELGVSCGSFHLEDRPEARYPGQVRAAIVLPKLISATPADEKSVFLSFFLPRSSYATVLLREILSR